MAHATKLLDILDTHDPLQDDCEGCGALAGEQCLWNCLTWPTVIGEVASGEHLADTVAGRLAVAIAHDLRTAGVPGNPTATTTGGNNIAVVLSHPSGRDWVVCAVEPEGSVFYVARYLDAEDAEAIIEVEIHDRFSAQRAIVDMLARAHAASEAEQASEDAR